MNFLRTILFLACASNIFFLQALAPWTWCFKKKFNTVALHDGSVAFSKENIPDFSQLLFSWNAFRPKKGFFRFLIQVRYADTHKWSEWHPMFKWGVGIQRSLYSKGEDGLVYNYVRLQVPKKRLADGFKVAVEIVDGAQLSDVKMLACSCANFNNFATEVASTRYKKLKSVKIDGVSMVSQMFLKHPSAESLCSPVSLSLLTGFMLDAEVDPVAFANKSHDQGLDIYGSWPLNTAHAFEVGNGKLYAHVQRLHSFRVLYNYLQQKIPVVVSVRGILEGGAKTHFDGHLLLVVGYDAETQSVLCHDSAVGYGLRISAGRYLSSIPSPKNTLKQYPLHNFLQVWEARNRLAYVVELVHN